MSEQLKSFTARVQVGCRVQIPDPLRIVLKINEGDIVELTIKKVDVEKPQLSAAPTESSPSNSQG